MNGCDAVDIQQTLMMTLVAKIRVDKNNLRMIDVILSSGLFLSSPYVNELESDCFNLYSPNKSSVCLSVSTFCIAFICKCTTYKFCFAVSLNAPVTRLAGKPCMTEFEEDSAVPEWIVNVSELLNNQPGQSSSSVTSGRWWMGNSQESVCT